MSLENMLRTLKVFVKSLKEGWKCGFGHSLKKRSIKSLLAQYVLERILEVR